METVTSFLERRLPHLEEMSEQQHALVTLINAACYVSDQASKQVLFAKVCEHIGIVGEATFYEEFLLTRVEPRTAESKDAVCGDKGS